MRLSVIPSFYSAEEPNVINIHPIERGLSIAAGAAAIKLSKYFRLKGRLSLLTLGGALTARGLSGYSIIYGLLQGSTQKRTRLKDIGVVVQGPVRVRRVATLNKPLPEVENAIKDRKVLTEVISSLPLVKAINFGQEDFSVSFSNQITLTFATKTELIAPNTFLVRGKERESLVFELKVGFHRGAGSRTVMQVDLGIKPPLGRIGELATQPLTPFLNKLLTDFVMRFKMRVETGEISTIWGQPTGTQVSSEVSSKMLEAPIEHGVNKYATAGARS